MKNFAPDYGAIGFVTLELEPGTYYYDAEGNCGTWSGNFNIVGGNCSAILLDQ